MKYERGTTLPLSVPRQVVCDLLHFAKAVPTVPVQRVVDVGRLAALRARLPQRVGWCAVFTKAFALVGQEVPALRRAYLEYPRPRLYEHPVGVASVAVERDYEGEPGVFFTRIRRPDGLTLPAVEAALRSARERPVEDAFARIIRGYRLPRVVRRAFLWYFLNVCGSRKAQSLGTFGVSTYSARGAESLHPLSPLTTTLNYGVVAPDGTVPVLSLIHI